MRTPESRLNSRVLTTSCLSNSLFEKILYWNRHAGLELLKGLLQFLPDDFINRKSEHVFAKFGNGNPAEFFALYGKWNGVSGSFDFPRELINEMVKTHQLIGGTKGGLLVKIVDIKQFANGGVDSQFFVELARKTSR